MDSCLRGLRFLFPVHIGHEGNVDERKVLRPNTELELPHRLNEGRGFDVANSSAELK